MTRIAPLHRTSLRLLALLAGVMLPQATAQGQANRGGGARPALLEFRAPGAPLGLRVERPAAAAERLVIRTLPPIAAPSGAAIARPAARQAPKLPIPPLPALLPTVRKSRISGWQVGVRLSVR